MHGVADEGPGGEMEWIVTSEDGDSWLPIPENLMRYGPIDGCVVLGKQSPRGVTYATRYRVDRRGQREELCCTAFQEYCAPCLLPDSKDSCCGLCWAFVRSQVCLLALHLLVLFLGITKETLHIKDIDERLYFAEAVAETVITCLLLLIRLLRAHQCFRQVKLPSEEMQQIDVGVSVRGWSFRLWLISLLMLGCLAILAVSGAFLLLYLNHLLYWSPLLNNVTLLLFGSCTKLFVHRATITVDHLWQDHAKAVLFESALLLREGFASHDKQSRLEYFQKVDQFLRALDDTPVFVVPTHLRLHPGYEYTNWEAIAAAEKVTTV